jgi:hypothetical protein
MMDLARRQRLIRSVEGAVVVAFKKSGELGLYLNEEVVRDYDAEDYLDYGEYDQGVIRVSVEDYRDVCDIFRSGGVENPVLLRIAARNLITTLRSQLKMGSKKTTGVLSRIV